mgnify:CR=1 FL=1
MSTKTNEEEIIRLKKRINFLLDYQANLVKENTLLKNECEVMRDKLGRYSDADVRQEPEVDEWEKYSKLLLLILRKLKSEEKWIAFKNNTANSKEYNRIDKAVLDEIISGFSENNEMIIKIMANFGIIKVNGKKEYFSIVIDKTPTKIYLLRKSALDMVSCSVEEMMELWG